jgi:hypothetical protein
MSLSRPTASKITRKLSCTAALCLGLIGLSAGPAMAGKLAPVPKLAPESVNLALAVCPGQTFSQPFEALGDVNYYTLVEGSEFNSSEEGWALSGGAQIVETSRPDGSTGGALDLPTGAEAVSPPVCVTLQYPTARMWVQNAVGGGAVTVTVAYAGTKTEEAPKNVGQLQGIPGSIWTPSKPFAVQPQIAGKTEEVREVRFHLIAGGKGSDFHLYGLYVDPRMS